jgi:hypothetical protein
MDVVAIMPIERRGNVRRKRTVFGVLKCHWHGCWARWVRTRNGGSRKVPLCACNICSYCTDIRADRYRWRASVVSELDHDHDAGPLHWPGRTWACSTSPARRLSVTAGHTQLFLLPFRIVSRPFQLSISRKEIYTGSR